MTVDNVDTNDAATLDAMEKRVAPDDLNKDISSKKLKLEDDKDPNGNAVESPRTPTALNKDITSTPPTASPSPSTTRESPSNPTTVEASPEDTCRGRRSRRSAVAAARAVEKVKPKKAPAKKKKVQDTEEEFSTAWICCECNEAECMMTSDADQLLICEGLCRRLFHYPCAGLPKPPEEADSFVCQDCKQGRHMCAFCQNYGDDNEDVFQCSADKCGLFFHEACLEINGVKVELIKRGVPSLDEPVKHEDSDDEEMISRQFDRVFQCPAHHCWTCTQTDMLAEEKKETRGVKKKKGLTNGKLFAQKTFPLVIVS